MVCGSCRLDGHARGEVRMLKLVGAAAVLVVLVGCSASTSPTPEVGASAAVAPTATPTPAPTPTRTPTTAPTSTPEPSVAAEVSIKCAQMFAPLVAALEGLDSYLDSDHSVDDYSAKVKGVEVVYNRVFASVPKVDGLTTDELVDLKACIELVGTPAENAYNEYAKALSAWRDNPDDDQTIQDHWSTATDTIAAVKAAMPDVPLPTPAADVVKINGQGSKNTKKFDVQGGDYAVVFSGKSTSSYGGNAILHLVAADGGDTEFLFNEIVDGRGHWKYDTNVYSVDPGSYYLEIDAPKGTWSVVLTEQR
jgi:hypothetical protein